MTGESVTRNFDSARLRAILGQYPTGVTVVTGIEAGGNPVGLALGSFTSVSLDPPLVAFLADKSSTSWPKIEASGAFCVNVLASDQENVCRIFASKELDKFRDLAWEPAPGGSPIIDGVVAWVDCEITRVEEAGDHYIVVGRVRDLDVARECLPLLFFRGGYGSFRPLSFASLDVDILHNLRAVDLVRPCIEDVARELDVECAVAVLAGGGEMAYIARAGTPRDGGVSTRVGWRLPFRPPVGATFVAWGEPYALDMWLKGAHFQRGGRFDRRFYEGMLQRIRDRGYSIGMGHSTHARLFETFASPPVPPPDVGDNAEIAAVIDDLLPGYDQSELQDEQSYEVQTISAPVFGAEGEVPLQITIYGLPRHSTGSQIRCYAQRLLEATGLASEKLAHHFGGDASG